MIADPGSAAPGTALTDPATVVDAGVLGGTGYGLTPSAQRWSVATGPSTKAGTCTVHDLDERHLHGV